MSQMETSFHWLWQCVCLIFPCWKSSLVTGLRFWTTLPPFSIMILQHHCTSPKGMQQHQLIVEWSLDLSVEWLMLKVSKSSGSELPGCAAYVFYYWEHINLDRWHLRTGSYITTCCCNYEISFLIYINNSCYV